MLEYVQQNILFVEEFCREKMPEIKPVRPQASFLVWLNCRDLNLDHDALVDFFVNKAQLALNDGEMFGIGGEGFMRLNVATQRSILSQALNQLYSAYKTLR
jgi:cystathionine beta-lyase